MVSCIQFLRNMFRIINSVYMFIVEKQYVSLFFSYFFNYYSLYLKLCHD